MDQEKTVGTQATLNEENFMEAWREGDGKNPDLVIDRTYDACQNFMTKWMDGIKEHAEHGEGPWIINNYVPFEILQAMDIPFLELAGPIEKYFEQIADSLPDGGPMPEERVRFGEAMKSIGKCGECMLEGYPELDWFPKLGGMILRQYECTVNTNYATHLARMYNKPLFLLERTNTMPFYPRYPEWWKIAEDDWESLLDKDEVDHYVEQLKSLIRFLEITTGKVFRMSKLEEIVDRINETCHYQKKIRDLFSRTSPVPVGIADHLEVYSPFQHHGEPGVTEVLKTYYEEILERVENGKCLCPAEKTRLYWCKGAWYSNVGYYRMFEKSHGAVFASSWYMNLGADAYPRANNGDPLRTIASRRIFQGNYEGPHWDFRNAKFASCQGAIMHKNQATWTMCVNWAELGTMRETYKKYFDRNGIPMLLLDPMAPKQQQYDQTARFIEDLQAGRFS